jgi:hypothetical protein
MNPELSRLIDMAATISTSGRWTAVNEKIQKLSAKTDAANEWWVQLFSALCFKTFSEYLLLKRAYEEKNKETALIAWRARNLLELSVWCSYCAKSSENARRFYEDAGRDVLGIFDAFARWGTATRKDPAWLDNIAKGRKVISQQATSDGIALDGPFKEVRDAAEEVGIGEHFKVGFRMLSKAAHPTAMQILGSQNDLQNDTFYSQGCLCFAGAFDALEKELLKAPVEEGRAQSA